MNGSKRTSKQLLSVFIIFILIIMCTISQVYASEEIVDPITPPGTEEGGTTGESGTGEVINPYIEMKVKANKVGANNQILVECWASKVTALSELDVVFTYDNSRLTPSYINGANKNKVLENLNKFSYEESLKFDIKENPDDNQLYNKFKQDSLEELKNSFEFTSDYSDKLFITAFEYRGPSSLQFAVSEISEGLSNIDSQEPTLIGTFSFQQTANTTISEDMFSTNNIIITSGNNDEVYARGEGYEGFGTNCEEIIEFTYQQYGSISGTIETGYYNMDINDFKTIGDNIATIKVYKAADVASIDWNSVGKEYRTAREAIQPIIQDTLDPKKQLNIPDKNTEPTIKPIKELQMDKTNLGEFKIENVPYGEYVVFIDKQYYSDSIVTNVIIDDTNQDIDLGKKTLIAGDFNKDGKIDARSDRTVALRLLENTQQIEMNYGVIVLDFNDDNLYSRKDTFILLRTIEAVSKVELTKSVEVKEVQAL